jgi:hypothetical protein
LGAVLETFGILLEILGSLLLRINDTFCLMVIINAEISSKATIFLMAHDNRIGSFLGDDFYGSVDWHIIWNFKYIG